MNDKDYNIKKIFVLLKVCLLCVVFLMPCEISSKQLVCYYDLYTELTKISIEIPVSETCLKSYHLYSEPEGDGIIIFADSLIVSFTSQEDSLLCDFLPINYSPFLKDSKYYLDVELTNGSHITSDTVVVSIKMPDTGLPVIRIELVGEVSNIQKESYLPAKTTMIQGRDTVLYNELSKLKGRGNGTWKYPKKPYKIKFDKKVPLLGEGKHYALLASYTDKTFLRHAISMDLSSAINMDWTPSYQYVDLIINNEYLGTYILTETVRRDNKRVKLMDDGCLIEDDAYYAEEPLFFQTKLFSRFFTFKYPDPEELTQTTLESVKNTIGEIERHLSTCEENDSIFEYVDINSFAKWYYLNNVLKNLDPNLFFYKESSSQKMKMGPYWDTEWVIGNGWYYGERPNPEHWIVSRTPYFDKLANNASFMTEVKRFHATYRNDMIDVFNKSFNKYKNLLVESQRLNYQRWPNLNELVDIGLKPLGSWELECDDLDYYFFEHIKYIDDWLSYNNTDNISYNKWFIEPGSYYNLKGVKTDNISKGIYIYNGKKYLLKK